MKAEALIELYKRGLPVSKLLNTTLPSNPGLFANNQLFGNVDGVKFLTHDMGCGGTRSDAQALCGLLA